MKRFLPMAAALWLTGACAGIPPTLLADGRQSIFLEAWVFDLDATPFGEGVGTWGPAQQVRDATCDVRNDRGSWRLTATGWVDVVRSDVPLEISCTKPGYNSVRISIPCLTDSARQQARMTELAARLVVGVGLAMAVPVPSAPSLGPMPAADPLGGMAIGAAAKAAGHAASTGTLKDGPPAICSYGFVDTRHPPQVYLHANAGSRP